MSCDTVTPNQQRIVLVNWTNQQWRFYGGAPVTLSPDPLWPLWQGVCINNTMTDFLQWFSTGNENWKRDLSSVSFISPRQLWDLCGTKVRLWLIPPVPQLFLLRNRCRKSQLWLPVSFKGDLIKLSMKFQNVSPVLERSKVWVVKSQVSPIAPKEF